MAHTMAGIALGLLIGVLSGTVALVLLKTLRTASLKDISSVVTLTSEMLAIATFWFGGAWVSTSLLKLLTFELIIHPYLIALFISFTGIVIYPLFRMIVRLGEDLGRDEAKNV